ncbi:hypothetical protein ABBQ32_010300 [Trebouxia sp. C0010 RCD-2024]
MDPLDTAAPKIDLQHEQDLAGVVQSSKFLSVLIVLAALLFTLGLIRLYLSKGKGNAVLLLGPSGSGKTTLFLQLRDGDTHNGTVASMQENAGTFALSTEQAHKVKPVQVVDVPGHPKVRSRFEGHIDGARGIIFVLDSVDFMGQKTTVAEQLLEVLVHPTVRRRRIPVLIACNKSDEGAKAHTVDFVRKRLEREINQIRQTQGTLEDSGGVTSVDIMGNVQEEFTFEALQRKNRMSVTSVSCSALTGNIDELSGFVRRCLPA